MVLGLRSFLVGACGRCSEGSGDSGGFSESERQAQGGVCGKVRGSAARLQELICISFACRPPRSRKGRCPARPSPTFRSTPPSDPTPPGRQVEQEMVLALRELLLLRVL